MRRYFFDNNQKVDIFEDYINMALPKLRREGLTLYEFSSSVELFKIKHLLVKELFQEVIYIVDEAYSKQRICDLVNLSLGNWSEIVYRFKPTRLVDELNRFNPHQLKSDTYVQLDRARYEFGFEPSKVELKIDVDNIQLLYSSLMSLEELGIEIAFLRFDMPNDDDLVMVIKRQLQLFQMHSQKKKLKLKLSDSIKRDFLWRHKIGGNFFGLLQLDIDLTNKCTHSCLFCGLYSPEVIERIKSYDDKEAPRLMTEFMKLTIETDKVIEMVKRHEDTLDLVCLGGAGDPFLHKDIVKIITFIAARDIHVHLFTNFDYISKEQLKEISSYGDPRFLMKINAVVNLSAASAKVFAQVRPKQSEKDYDRIYDLIKYAGDLREHEGRGLTTTIMTVLNKINYRELPLYPFLIVDVNAHDFFPKPLEIHSDEVKKYALDESDLKEHARLAKLTLYFCDQFKINVRMREFLESAINKYQDFIKEFEETYPFEKQIEDLLENHQLDFEGYLKRSKLRQLENSPPIPWQRSEEKIKKIDLLEDPCYGDLLPVDVEVGQTYSQAFYSKYPCRIGEIYARVMVDGNVLPCCVSDYPIGNVKEQSLDHVMNSQGLALFNETTKNFPIDKAFNKVEEWSFCKNCCHIHLNKKIHFYTQLKG